MVLFRPGDVVERDLDGSWFPAVIIKAFVGSAGSVYNLEYLDDGNIEDEVPEGDIRLAADQSLSDGHVSTPRTDRKPPILVPLNELLMADNTTYEEKIPKIVMHRRGSVETEEEGKAARRKCFDLLKKKVQILL